MRRFESSMTTGMSTVSRRLTRSALSELQLLVAAAELVVDRGELLVGRLELLLGRLELLVHALELLVDRDELLVRGRELVVRAAVLLDEGRRGIPSSRPAPPRAGGTRPRRRAPRAGAVPLPAWPPASPARGRAPRRAPRRERSPPASDARDGQHDDVAGAPGAVRIDLDPLLPHGRGGLPRLGERDPERGEEPGPRHLEEVWVCGSPAGRLEIRRRCGRETGRPPAGR